MTNNERFTFRWVEKNQQQHVLEWIKQPHIAKWLHGDGLNNTINDLDGFLNKKHSWATHWLAFDCDIPFAYLITSELEECEEHPNGGVTLDLFICNLDYLGKGLAVQMIHEFILSQFPHAHCVLIDPEIANERAVHVYKKAGFKISGEFIASWHPVPHYTMLLSVDDLKSTQQVGY